MKKQLISYCSDSFSGSGWNDIVHECMINPSYRLVTITVSESTLTGKQDYRAWFEQTLGSELNAYEKVKQSMVVRTTESLIDEVSDPVIKEIFKRLEGRTR